ncbi:hypothetical protein JHK82_011920 [Glycine max]|nr:hypothetical protein JHK85_012249 [Glycine max]KAG5153951.1 hypothetical protein JHK82_011920 [Glycine max]
MSTGELLNIEPLELKFPFELKKQISCSLQLSNKTDSYVAFKSVKTVDGTSPKDITADMFNKEAGHVVEECKLRVLYVSPPQPPSPVPEGSEEGSSPRGSVSENGNANGSDFTQAARGFTERPESQDKSAEARALISRLTEEKNNAIQQNSKLHQELELLKREGNKSRGGVSFVIVVLIGLLGIIMGYLMKKT